MAEDKFITLTDRFSDDLNMMIHQWIFGSEGRSLTVSNGGPPTLFQIISLPKKLAKATNYPPFENMPLGPELIRLLRLCLLMKDRFPLVFALNSKMYPESLPSIQFFIEKVLNDPSTGTDEEKCCFLVETIHHLKTHDKCVELSYLIESIPDTLVDKFSDPSYLIKFRPDTLVDKTREIPLTDVEAIAYSVVTINPKNAFKLVEIFTKSHVRYTLILILASMDDEKFEFVRSELMNNWLYSCTSSEYSLDLMIEVASDISLKRYFPLKNALVFDRNMNLIDQISMRFPHDMIRVKAAFVRILYEIRFNVCTIDQIVEKIDHFILKTEQTTQVNLIMTLVSKLVNSAVLSGNYALLKALQRESKEGATNFNKLNSYLRLEQLFSNRQCMSSCELDTFLVLREMRVFENVTGNRPSEFIDSLDARRQLVVIAVMYGFDSFNDATRKIMREQIMIDPCEIVSDINQYVPNPVPFVNCVMRYYEEVSFDIPLSWDKYLLALLGDINSPTSGTIIASMKGSDINVGCNFFEAILKDETLAKAFNTVNGRRLMECILTSEYSVRDVLKLEKWQIKKLFRAMQIPVTFNTGAFSRFQYFDEVDEAARELIAIWPVMITVGVRSEVLDMRFKESEPLSLTLNPLRFSAFNMLSTWLDLNPESFVQRVDWRIVMSFFGAEPTWEFIVKIQDDCTYPSTLENVISTHYQKEPLSLRFTSDASRKNFEQVALPAIQNGARLFTTSRKVTCSIAEDQHLLWLNLEEWNDEDFEDFVARGRLAFPLIKSRGM